MSYYSDSSEWKWLFKNGMDWKTIFNTYNHSFSPESPEGKEYIETIEDIIDMVAKWSKDSVSKRATVLDSEGAGVVKDGNTILHPIMQKNYDEAKDLGLHGVSVSTENGGLGLPFSTIMLSWNFLSRACMSTSCQLNFFPGIADMIERFCDQEDISELIPKILSGELSGSMGLTEPEAGSDLGALRTSAKLDDEGNYILNGSKIFITNAGGGFCLTLGRTENAPEGLAGISMFLVKMHNKDGSNNYTVIKNEEKMGLKGSFTCQVVYENTKAKLVGKENEGFKYMLHLMNQSRIGVGVQAIGGIEACLDYVRKYGEQRKAFDKSLLDLPLYAHNLHGWEIETSAVRALIVDTVSHFDVYRTLDLKLQKTGDLSKSEKELFNNAKDMMIRRTPLVKYYSSELYVSLSSKAMQALGSYGYTKEYPMERWHRDSYGPLMYEGTSQIQALMALKDLIKDSMKNPMKFFNTFLSDNAVGKLVTGEDDIDRLFKTVHFKFYKNLGGLLFSTVRGDSSIFNAKSWTNIFKGKDAFGEKQIENMMVHSETITQALCYIETLEILKNHTKKDSSRKKLFNQYYKMVYPRLVGLFESWKWGKYDEL